MLMKIIMIELSQALKHRMDSRFSRDFFEHILGMDSTFEEIVEQDARGNFRCYNPDLYKTGRGNIENCGSCLYLAGEDGNELCALRHYGKRLERPHEHCPYLIIK